MEHLAFFIFNSNSILLHLLHTVLHFCVHRRRIPEYSWNTFLKVKYMFASYVAIYICICYKKAKVMYRIKNIFFMFWLISFGTILYLCLFECWNMRESLFIILYSLWSLSECIAIFKVHALMSTVGNL